MSHDSIFQSEGGGGGTQAPEMGSALSIPSVPGASGQLAVSTDCGERRPNGDEAREGPEAASRMHGNSGIEHLLLLLLLSRPRSPAMFR